MAALFQDQVGMARENMSGATGASVCVASLPDPLVQSGRGVNALVPASSSVVNNVIAINIDNGGPDNSAAVANFFSTNPTPITFTIKKGSLAGRITSLNLRFQVTGSATPAVLLPTFMWFSTIVVKCNDGQRELETYANQLEVMLDFCHNLKSAKMQRWAPQHNVNADLRGAARLFTQCPIFHPPPKRKKKVSRARDCNFHKYMSFLCTRSCVPCFGDALLVVGVGLEVRSAIFVEFFAAAVADMFVVCSVFFLAVRTY